jgi:hypothetical protein
MWNGGGYYGEEFECGQTYESGLTFYCSSDCYQQVGASKKIFLSYRWCDVEVADKISGCLRGAGVEILRDINRMQFLDSIASFMDSSGESRYFLAVATESYFYSRYCMYEFCKMADSEQPVRTIPIMLDTSADQGIEEKLSDYWRSRHNDLSRAIEGLDDGYTSYLESELSMLASIPGHINDFYALWRAKQRPGGSHWLVANCRYLAGAIKTTFQPSSEDASNWTYSNKTIRGERAEDAPIASNWIAKPFYLHTCSVSDSKILTDIAGCQELVLKVYGDDLSLRTFPAGVHIAVISKPALSSLAFCTRLQMLMDQKDVALVPMFLDKDLQIPTAELDILKCWCERVRCAPSEDTRNQIDTMLRRFGSMLQVLRDTLAPSPAALTASK